MTKLVQWYPGHMYKAKKEIQEVLSKIDLVIEVLDARVPISSHNQMLDELTKNKLKLLVFSKADLVDKTQLSLYLNHYQKLGYSHFSGNFSQVTGNTKLLKKIEQEILELRASHEKKGIKKDIRILIMGMPNVGKSTLINYLVKQRKTEVGNRPGVTKRQQWLKLTDWLQVLDTPGILVPKIENQEDGYKLVLCSLIKDEVVNSEDVAVYLLQKLQTTTPEVLQERYKIEINQEMSIAEIYDSIGEKIGALLKGREIDYERVTQQIINDFRNQKLGNLILDEIN